MVLSTLSLSASDMETEELLRELQICGLKISDGDDIELYKEEDYTEGLMPEYLEKLLQLGKLSNSQLDILCNLSLLPLLAHTHPYSLVILLICFAVIITMSVFCKSTSDACEIPVTG